MRIGIDFGTTNSGAAAFDGRRVRLFPIDRTARDPAVVRSALYVTRDHQVYVGQEAIDVYHAQNVGRASKLVRQYVGEVEMTFAELPTFVREVYVLVDELMPGRLLHSLKSELAGDYEGTTLFGRYYTLEELIGLYLAELRRRVEAEADEPVDHVVLGRPVHFTGAECEAGDRRAEERLRQAAGLAGFRQVDFELEPVAAALHYELETGRPQNVVVFDFGGGTLDVTVMRIGDPAGRPVFASGGVGIAGESFDRQIIERLLLDHFGLGTAWGPDALPFPRQYVEPLVDWQSIPELNRPETLQFLHTAQLTGSHPARVWALESLVVNNYAGRLIDAVERAKVALSTERFATIRLAGEGLNVWQPVTRLQFEALIAGAAARIERCVVETVERSGLRADEIDTVVRTGGSAQIPHFVAMMERLFPGKVVLSSVFSGVTAGLAIRAN